jgi:non-ribosomal peptide synthetase component F
MVLLSAFELLLARWSGQKDFVIGSPVANRNRPDVEALIGSFMNTLAIRSDLSNATTFNDLLSRVRHRALDALAHQEMPFEKLVAELQPERALGYSPVFQVMFILQNTPAPVSKAGDISFLHFDIDGGSSKMDLTLNLEETEEGADGWIEYATDLFGGKTAKQIVADYLEILQQVCADPETSVADLASERNQPSMIRPEVASELRGMALAGFEKTIAAAAGEPRVSITLPQIQHELSSIWSKVLNAPVVGIDDSLFDLGGHSLLVTQIISRIRKAWGVNVPIHHFFDVPTVRVISGIIESELKNKRPLEKVS